MKFISQYKKYKLWIDPAYYSVDATGKRFYHAGVCVKFDNGVYETNDQKIIEALLKEPVCGRDYAPVKIDTTSTIPAPEIAESKPNNNYDWVNDEKSKEPEKFTCEKCGKEFTKKFALVGHMNSHK